MWEPKPSCFEDGLEVCYCTVCKAIVWEKVLPAYGQHDFLYTSYLKESTCTVKGYKESSCNRCNKQVSTTELPLRDRQYVRLLKLPTANNDGGLIYKCFDCGHRYEGKERIAYESYSQGFEYEVDSEGTECSIVGIGDCDDEILYIPPEINGYAVTSIADGAFQSDWTLRFVILPPSHRSVGAQAFYGTELEDVYIPESISSIGSFAFGDTMLTFVKLPSTITDLSDGVFAYCAVLKRVTLGNYVQTIGERAFKDCIHLSEMTLPVGVIRISEEAFYNCSGLERINIPYTLRILEKGAFLYCSSLNSVSLPEGLSVLEPWVFGHCSALSDIQLPSTIKTVGDNAFYGCASLLNVTFYSSLEYIGFEAFKYDAEGTLTIRYMGSRAKWNAVSKHAEWRPANEPFVAVCNSTN